jgi:hypothetical protein
MAVYLLQSGDIGGFHHICHTVQPIGPIAAVAILDFVVKQSLGGLTAWGGGGNRLKGAPFASQVKRYTPRARGILAAGLAFVGERAHVHQANR